MPQSFTAVVPVTNADAAANLTPQMPLGSETRIIAGTYSAIQKLLNMAAAAATWWLGGTLGDPANVGDATKTVTIQNPVVFESNVAGAIDVTASGNIAAGNNVNSGLDVISGRDVTAARDMTAARDIAVGRNAVVAGTMAVAGALTAALGGLLVAPFVSSGTGRFLNRSALIPTTAGALNLDMNSAQMFIGQTTAAGDQTATIINPHENDTIEVIVGGIHTVTFAGTGTSGLAAMNGASNTPYLRAVFLSSVWRVLQRGILV